MNIVLHQEFGFEGHLVRKRYHFGQFLTNIGLTQMVKILRI